MSDKIWFIMAITLPIIGIFLLSLWVSMVFHLINHKEVKNRTLWVILLFITGVIGGVIYYFVVKRKLDKNKQESMQNIQ